MPFATDPPRLFTFDIFGTVIDWKRGLAEALGRPLDDAAFNRFIDFQGRDEQAHFRLYREITARSLIGVFSVDEVSAYAIGERVGHWPLFDDSIDGLRRLLTVAPCVATTNSDRAHATQVQTQLGFRLSHWICAEDERVYKPNPEMWQVASVRLGVPLDRRWWHVSAYGDYDLGVARQLGLTCVFVERPHARPGPADLTVPDLRALASHCGV